MNCPTCTPTSERTAFLLTQHNHQAKYTHAHTQIQTGELRDVVRGAEAAGAREEVRELARRRHDAAAQPRDAVADVAAHVPAHHTHTHQFNVITSQR